MFKKLFSIIITLTLVTGMIALPSKAEDKQELSGFVTSLGIINPSVDTASDYVTRELAAVYIAKMCNINLDTPSNVRYFTDVEADGFSATAINSLLEMGIISSSDNRTFKPGEYITVNEAIKMLVCAAGYGMYAEMSGGYPKEYLRAASNMGITIRSSEGGKITVAQMSHMIYDTLRSPYLTVDPGYSKIDFTSDDDVTVLSYYWDIYEDKGTVTTTYGGSMNKTESIAGKEYAIINGDVYNLSDNIDIYPYLGSYVRYFYEDFDNNSGDKRLVYIEDKAQKESLVVNTDDFEGFSQNVFSYIPTGTNSVKKITLNNPIIIYNGSVLGTNVEQTLANLNKGKLELKDSNNDSKYDVIVITDYRNFYVSSIDADKKVIYNKFDNTFNISWDDYSGARSYDEMGNAIEFTDIVSDQLLSVAASNDAKYVEVIACKSAFKGQISSISGGDEREAVINDTVYKIDKSYFNEFCEMAVIGMEYSFMLDNFGQVAYIGDGISASMQFGFVIDAFAEAGGEEAWVKMLKQNGEVANIRIAGKLSVDGTSVKGRPVNRVLQLFNSDNGGQQQLVMYGLKDDEICKIDTREISAYENDTNSLYDIFYDRQTASRWYNSYNLGRKCVMTSKTPVFYVPVERASDELYKVSTVSLGMKNDISYISDAYKTSSRNAFADAVVVYYDSSTFSVHSSTQPFVIDKIEQRGEDGEVITVISGFEKDAKKEAKVYPDSGVNIEKLERGDVVFFVYDYRGRVTKASGFADGYELIFDRSEGPLPAGDHWKNDNADGYVLYNKAYAGNYRAEFQASHGWIVRKNGTVVRINASEPNGDGSYTEEVNLSGLTIVVYDEFEKEVRIGKIEDILDYESVGNKRSEIIYISRGGAGNMAIIYNYR